MTIGEFGFDFEYITDADRDEYQRFCVQHLNSYGRSLVNEVWHYTNAEGLIGILQTGKLWSTHVSCLNDSKEQMYFGDLLHERIKSLIGQDQDPEFEVFLKLAESAFLKRDFPTAWHYVSCFSEAKDDLGQWRGYGGGNCGYSIGFACEGIIRALGARPSTLFVPMQYEDAKHKCVVDAILRKARKYFYKGLNDRPVTNIERWAKEFLIAFFFKLDIFASTTKHSKFAGEEERRIVAILHEDDRTSLEFKQKQTLLARHLPIDLTIDKDGAKRLPLTRVYVGPGPAQRVSQVSVEDLLMKCGYNDIPVEVSIIPYRVP